MATTEQEELMLRLQSQFGDMDLTNLLQQEEKGQPQSNDNNDAESEESSAVEPTPEELRAWQEAQFNKGQAQQQAKKEATQSAIQKRRDQALQEDDWEELPSAPNLQGQPSVFFPSSTTSGGAAAEIVGVHPLLQQLAAGDPLLGTAWRRLFSSSDGDGLSFANFARTLEGYPGPTVLLMGAIPSASKSLDQSKASTPTSIGFFRTADDSPDCFLFAFDDREEIEFFRPSRPDKPQVYMRCQSPQQNTSITSTEGGLYIGGSSSHPRLHLTESLEECRALEFCHVFEAGDLLLGHAKESLHYFDVTHLELWAVGGEEWIRESLATQNNHQAIGEANRLKAQKVDKLQFLQDFQGGLLSANMKPGGLFAHHGYNADRCDL